MSLRERLDTLSRGELAGLIVVLVATLAGVGFWYTSSLPKPIQIAETPAPVIATPAPPSVSGALVSGSPGASTSPAAQLMVDVAGLVRKPGVYAFEPGSRVIDAIHRAGGAKPGADLTLLNLAAPLGDGQQILVQKEGAAPAAGMTGQPGTGGALININTSDETTLETLNGVGPSLATAIIQYRTEHGPFTSVDQLDEVSGIGPATLEKLRPQVTV